MNIAGIQHGSLTNWPGRVSSVLWCQGCNFNCEYCHNKILIKTKPNTEAFACSIADSMMGKPPYLTITGGEPTLQSDLIEFCSQIKMKGVNVKIDTNGSRPAIVRKLVDIKIDYIAMDIKCQLRDYRKIVGPCDPDMIRESVKIIQKSGVPHEFRTTCFEEAFTIFDLKEMAKLIGKSNWYLQDYIGNKFTQFPESMKKFISENIHGAKWRN